MDSLWLLMLLSCYFVVTEHCTNQSLTYSKMPLFIVLVTNEARIPHQINTKPSLSLATASTMGKKKNRTRPKIPNGEPGKIFQELTFRSATLFTEDELEMCLRLL